MPSLMGGKGGMQMQKMGDMDDMMSKMMSKMGGMDMGSTSMGSNSMSSKSSFSSSSSSSFSSSSSSSMMSSEMGGGMPPMRGMQMPLNMQQYSPEDITIKLNGQELTVEAAAHGEKFNQKHIIPDNINLDAMSSSFSSDGVLVVKAPKK